MKLVSKYIQQIMTITLGERNKLEEAFSQSLNKHPFDTVTTYKYTNVKLVSIASREEIRLEISGYDYAIKEALKDIREALKA